MSPDCSDILFCIVIIFVFINYFSYKKDITLRQAQDKLQAGSRLLKIIIKLILRLPRHSFLIPRNDIAVKSLQIHTIQSENIL